MPTMTLFRTAGLVLCLFLWIRYSLPAQDCLSVNPTSSEVVLNPGSGQQLPPGGGIVSVPCNKEIVNLVIALDFKVNTEPYFEDSTQLVALLLHNGFTYFMDYDKSSNQFRLPGPPNGLGAGNYSLTISASACSPNGSPCNNCFASYAFDLAYTNGVNLDASILTDPATAALTCKPGSSVTLKGSPPPNKNFTVEWAQMLANQFVPIAGANTPAYLATQAGTYRYTISGPAGCTASNMATVFPPELPTATVNPALQALNSCVQALSGGTVANTGGSANVSYAWSASNNGVIKSGENTLAPFVSAPGSYTLLVTRLDNACTATAMVQVVPGNVPLITVEFAKNPNTSLLDCKTTQMTLKASGKLSSGASPFTFVWADGTNGPNLTVNAPGTYSVTATATAIGCQGVGAVTIGQDVSVPGVSVWSNRDTICTGASVLLTAVAQEPVTYLWQNNATGNAITAQISAAGDHPYTVTVTAADNGCTNTASHTIVTLPVPAISCAQALITTENAQAVDLGCVAADGQLIWLASAVNVANIPPTGAGPLEDQVYTLGNPQAPGRVHYVLYARNAGCTSDKAEVTVRVLPASEDGIYIPELITPNGDGVHDTWAIVVSDQVANPAAYTLALYDRYGAKVYEGDLATPFDASPYPDGAYFYLLTKPGGQALRGAVTILRRP